MLEFGFNKPKIAKSEIPWLVSLVPHEWHNDEATVSTRDPVKSHSR